MQAIFDAGGLYLVLSHDSVEDSAWAVRNILDKCPHFKEEIFFKHKFLAKLEESLNDSQSETFRENLIQLHGFITVSDLF
jgi:hypothetical protein